MVDITVSNGFRDELHACATTGRWWEPKGRPTIPTDWIRELVVSSKIPGTAAPVHAKGVRIRGVVLDSQLDLEHANLATPLYLDDIDSAEPIILEHANGSWISITNSRIAGLSALQLRLRHSLDLSGAVSSAPINLQGARITGDILFRGGSAAQGFARSSGAPIHGQMSWMGGTFTSNIGYAINIDGAEVGGGVFLSGGFSAEGEVRLLGVSIGGHLLCENGSFSNKDGDALSVDGAEVGGGVFLSGGFSAEGEVRLLGVSIGGPLSCKKGTFSNAGGDALSVDGAEIGGDMFLSDGFKAQGEVRLLGAVIGGQLSCTGGTFSAPDGTGLTLQEVKVKGAFVWRPEELAPRTRLDLTAASIDLLSDDIAAWPESGRLVLDRFTYAGFAPSASSNVGANVKLAQRVDWIALMDGFHSQPYEQLASVYRATGKMTEARYVGTAKEKARNGSLHGWWRRRLHMIWGGFTAYGYRPGRSLWVFAVFLALAGVFFLWAGSSGVMEPTDLGSVALATDCTENYPCYQPFIFAADVLIPIVDLDQRDAWAADVARGGIDVAYWPWALGGTAVRWVTVLLIAVGWALTAAFIASASRTISRS